MYHKQQNKTPKFIYRIDRRPPDEVFVDGLKSWGLNLNIFHHVLGYSLSDNLILNQRSGFISASSSKEAIKTFLWSNQSNVDLQIPYYLYKIRADENVYSLQKTLFFYQQKLEDKNNPFCPRTKRHLAHLINFCFSHLMAQQEWFNAGNIPKERIVWAQKINLSYFWMNNQKCRYIFPLSEKKVIHNKYYLEKTTYANTEAYKNYANKLDASFIKVAQSLSGYKTFGFTCSLPPNSPAYVSNPKNINELVCYQKEKNKDLVFVTQKRKKTKNKTFDLYLTNKEGSHLWICKLNKGLSLELTIKEVKKTKRKTQVKNGFVFDAFQRVTWKNKNQLLLALEPLLSHQSDQYQLFFRSANINEQTKKWKFVPIKNEQNRICFSLVNLAFPSLRVHIKEGQKGLFLKNPSNDPDFEEVFITFETNEDALNFLRPQSSDSVLIDLQINYLLNKQTLPYLPHKKYFQRGTSLKNTIFYDLSRQRIFYIENNHKVYNLMKKGKRALWKKTKFDKNKSERFSWSLQKQIIPFVSPLKGWKIYNKKTKQVLKIGSDNRNYGKLFLEKKTNQHPEPTIFIFNDELEI